MKPLSVNELQLLTPDQLTSIADKICTGRRNSLNINSTSYVSPSAKLDVFRRDQAYCAVAFINDSFAALFTRNLYLQHSTSDPEHITPEEKAYVVKILKQLVPDVKVRFASDSNSRWLRIRETPTCSKYVLRVLLYYILIGAI